MDCTGFERHGHAMRCNAKNALIHFTTNHRHSLVFELPCSSRNRSLACRPMPAHPAHPHTATHQSPLYKSAQPSHHRGAVQARVAQQQPEKEVGGYAEWASADDNLYVYEPEEYEEEDDLVQVEEDDGTIRHVPMKYVQGCTNTCARLNNAHTVKNTHHETHTPRTYPLHHHSTHPPPQKHTQYCRGRIRRLGKHNHGHRRGPVAPQGPGGPPLCTTHPSLQWVHRPGLPARRMCHLLA